MDDLAKQVALLHEITKQNRIIELRLKYEKAKDERVKQLLKAQIENLKKSD